MDLNPVDDDAMMVRIHFHDEFLKIISELDRREYVHEAYRVEWENERKSNKTTKIVIRHR